MVEEVPLSGGTFSAQLVPQISGLLDKHKFRKRKSTFIVVSGPGSFTGLRVGLAAISRKY
jgi:tRNA A37 threonylcarbamoyladenosine modification protein TsaB